MIPAMEANPERGLRAVILTRARDWKRTFAPLHVFGGRPLLEAPLPVSQRCGLPLHLTFDLEATDPLLRSLGITTVKRLALLACFHLEYATGAALMVEHRDGGARLEVLREPKGVLVQGVPSELPQLPVELELLSEAEAGVEAVEDLPDDHPPLHQVGGHPTWIGPPRAAPRCPRTRQPMRYVATIDSIRRFPVGDTDAALMFGDPGLCHVYWSDGPSISACVIDRA